MKDEDFKKQLITALKIEKSIPEVQDDVLLKLEDLAYARVGNALPEMLTPEQMQHVEQMYKDKKSDDEIMDWIEASLPNFKEMMQAILLDIAAEFDIDGKK